MRSPSTARSQSWGDKAEFGKDAIKVSGKLLQTKEVPIYIAFNKPRGVVSTMNDPENRPCLATYLGKVKGRFSPLAASISIVMV